MDKQHRSLLIILRVVLCVLAAGGCRRDEAARPPVVPDAAAPVADAAVPVADQARPAIDTVIPGAVAPPADGPAPAVDAPAPPPPAGSCPQGRALVWRLDLGHPDWNGGAAGVQATVKALGGTEMVSGPEHASVVSDPEHGNALQVLYAVGSGSNPCVDSGECTSVGGLAFRLPLPNGSSITSAVLSYWVKFDTGFQWVKGGKLPGLCGNDCSTGGAAVYPDRFSIRYMWRGGGAAEIYSYLTHPPNSGYGLDMGVGSWHWKNDGAWHRIQEELILNSANRNDGIIRVWYDTPTTSPPVFEEKDLNYYDRVKYPNLGIDTFIFSTFHGGHDRSWSPSKDAHAYFADFQLCQ